MGWHLNRAPQKTLGISRGNFGGKAIPFPNSQQKTTHLGGPDLGPEVRWGTFWGCFCGCGGVFLCNDSMLKVENHGDKNLCPNQSKSIVKPLECKNLNFTLFHDLLSLTKIPKSPLVKACGIRLPHSQP